MLLVNGVVVEEHVEFHCSHTTDHSGPLSYVTRGAEDFIAPLWSDLDDMGWMGMFSYQQYTTGSVLTRATQDINQYFPQMSFNASWVFVVTWDYVETLDMNTFIRHSAQVSKKKKKLAQGHILYRVMIIHDVLFWLFQAITFQVVLITDGNLSFFLINYGDCAVIYDQVEVKQTSQDWNSILYGLCMCSYHLFLMVLTGWIRHNRLYKPLCNSWFK